MWKLLFQSVQGASHARTGQPCQDACLVRLRATPHGRVLLLLAADGAGSASLADFGARHACRAVLRMVLHDLRDGLEVGQVERDTALSWLLRLRRELEGEASARQVELGQFATTLLLAVVGEAAAAFAQVGDGAIVVRDGERYQPVFWPQSGEYANTTNFVTDEAVADNLVFELRPGRVDELALLTDGLQTLALSFAERSVHQPFFQPMFQKLRQAAPGQRLASGLRRFLDSPAVNQRSDDDKTLLLATRVPPCAAATQTA
jgi:hypothetical protein